MRVECETKDVVLENDSGKKVSSIKVICGRCDHSEVSFGRGEASVRRCLALFRENCPQNEQNYYKVEE